MSSPPFLLLSMIGLVKECHRAFVHQLEHYEIVQEDEKNIYSHKSSSLANPAKRREVKVNQYKKTQKIKDHIQVRLGSVARPH